MVGPLKARGVVIAQTSKTAFSDPGDDPIVDGLSVIIKQLGAGDRLPSERELARRLGVSRTALRDRLQQAEALGVLRRTVGSGTYVDQMNPHGLAVGLQLAIDASQLSLASLHAVRVGLERQAARDATATPHIDSLTEMEDAVQRMAGAARQAAWGEFAKADASFHRALMEAPGNPALSFFAQAMAKVRRDTMRRRTQQLGLIQRPPEFIVDLHTNVLAAVRTGDPERADASVEAHFVGFTQALVEIGQHPYAE